MCKALRPNAARRLWIFHNLFEHASSGSYEKYVCSINSCLWPNSSVIEFPPAGDSTGGSEILIRAAVAGAAGRGRPQSCPASSAVTLDSRRIDTSFLVEVRAHWPWCLFCNYLLIVRDSRITFPCNQRVPKGSQIGRQPPQTAIRGSRRDCYPWARCCSSTSPHETRTFE